MKQTYIEQIRKACIEANPKKDWEWQGDYYATSPSLADVLLAIGDRGLWSMNIMGNAVSFIHEPVKEQRHFVWHLCDDDLTLQDEETLKFITSLLTQ